MDTETMPNAMYFSGNTHTVTKINHVLYQTIQYDGKGMFPAQLMDNTSIQVFIDNGATPSILLLSTYNKHPILQKYLKTKSTSPIHTEGGTIGSHFWIEIPLKLQNQTIQIKVLVCDSECLYDILIGRLESDTMHEGVRGTLFQKQGGEWVVIGYHSKRLPASAKNFGGTELELTGLFVNIHGFM